MSATALVTEFLLAAEEGNIDALKACLEKGVDINVTNRQKRTAIIIASLKKHYACVEFLIAAGADIDKQDQTCFNPFLISCLTNDLTLLRIVLPANPDLDRLTRFGGVGITPASEKGHVEIVRELLEKTDINVNHTNFVGWTPLLEAIVLNDGGAKQQRQRKNHRGNALHFAFLAFHDENILLSFSLSCPAWSCRPPYPAASAARAGTKAHSPC